MTNSSLTAECNKIFNFWKLEEYFTPSDYPALVLTIKEGKQNIPFDAYYNDHSIRSLPLKRYKAHNEYLRQKNKSVMRVYIIEQIFIVAVIELKILLKKWLKNANWIGKNMRR